MRVPIVSQLLATQTNNQDSVAKGYDQRDMSLVHKILTFYSGVYFPPLPPWLLWRPKETVPIIFG
jgi:hypothetical protein